MIDLQAEILEKEEIKLVGFSIVDRLTNIIETGVVAKLRENLTNRLNEVENRSRNGIYLVQIYPDGHWDPTVPFTNIVAAEVSEFTNIPSDMMNHVVPAGRYVKFVHNGPESQIVETYGLTRGWYEKNGVEKPRPFFDMEYWSDIHTLDNENSKIPIFMPVQLFSN